MARGDRKRRKLLQSRPSTARERLLAAEERIEEVAAQHESLQRALDEARAELSDQVLRLAEQARDDYRKQVGVLDVVRRQQRRQDEDFTRRLEAAETALAGAAENSRERLAGLEERARVLEDSLAAAVANLQRIDIFRSEVGSLIERVTEGVDALRSASGVLSSRLDAVESNARRDLTELAALREQVALGRQVANAVDERVTTITDDLAAMGGQVTGVIGMLNALGDVPARLERFADDLQRFADRLTATELVVNQASDLELQLERAEEFERLMAEVDPANYATKHELERLRADLGSNPPPSESDNHRE